MELDGLRMERSGYGRDGIYRSLRPEINFPQRPDLDLVTYMLSGSAGDPTFAKKMAFIHAETGESLTFGEVIQSMRSVAAGLQELGVRQGSVVLVLLGNSIYFPVIFMAIASMGAVITTLNPLNTRVEITKQARDSGACFIITIPELTNKLEGIRSLPLVLLGDTTIESVAGLSFTPFSKLLAADPSKAPRVHIRQSDTAALLYSSGTTGVSKGVILSHRNFIAAQVIVDGIHEFEDVLEDEVLLCTVPFFHVYGLALVACAELRRGVTSVIMPKFGFLEMLEAIQRFRVTGIPVVPPIVLALTKLDVVSKYDLSSLRTISSGAAPLGKELMEKCSERFPTVAVNQGYGLTESTAMGTTTHIFSKEMHDPKSDYGSAGWLVSNTEAMVVDVETGRPLSPNRTGELWMRGHQNMQGYLNNAEATAATIDREGWLHTGDLVYFDNEGRLYVVDRIKELIKYKGFQVAPAELEAILISHPSILDSAVVPFPHEEAGQIPVAYVVRSPGSPVTEQEVIDFVAEQVAPYKKLRRVTFIEAIPKSASGKILRRELTQLSASKL